MLYCFILFSEKANTINFFFPKHKTTFLDLIARTAQISEASSVLEVGCGNGERTFYLKNTWGAKITGLTASAEQWAEAKNKASPASNPTYLLMDFLSSTLTCEIFDVIVSIENAQAIQNPYKFFSEGMRLLKPGGRFVTAGYFAKSSPKKWEKAYLLDPFYKEKGLDTLGSTESTYEVLESTCFQRIEFQDLSSFMKKKDTAAFYQLLKASLFKKDPHQVEGSFKMILKSLAAYQVKTLQYGLFSATKF